MKILAQIVSSVLNPFIMPFLGILLVFRYHDNFSREYGHENFDKIIWLGAILTLLFPIISLLVLYKSKVISDLNLTNKEERLIPTLVTLFYYFTYYFLLKKAEAIDESILSGYLGGCVALLISMFITPKWKISIHTMGIASLAGMFMGICQVSFEPHPKMILALLIGIGLVGSSRVLLKKHSLMQVYFGAILGFAVPYLFVVNGIVL